MAPVSARRPLHEVVARRLDRTGDEDRTLEGAERERILAIIRKAIATRPKVEVSSAS